MPRIGFMNLSAGYFLLLECMPTQRSLILGIIPVEKKDLLSFPNKEMMTLESEKVKYRNSV
jgi:hypothetical protein